MGLLIIIVLLCNTYQRMVIRIKKVAVLTMTGALNYGAILQAVALKKVLLDKDIEPHFVNYQTNRQKSQYSLLNIYTVSVKVIKKNLQNMLHIKEIRRRIKKFELCTQQEFFNNSTVLKTKKAVINYLRDFDTIIVGSDQVWNLNLNDSSSVYFLDFPKHEKRIAYAVSLGGCNENIEPYRDYILSKAKYFDFISVREDIAFDFFKSNKIDVRKVLDPTLLVEPSWWEKVAVRPPLDDSKYIIYYSVNCKSYSVKICQTISEYFKLPVYNLFLHPGIAKANFIPFYDIDPFEFLGMLKHATLICTDSYHGVIFSALFKKKFIVPAETKGDCTICEDRKLTFLKILNLTNHLYTENTSPEHIIALKDITDDDLSKINELKTQSINFILESLERTK